LSGHHPAWASIVLELLVQVPMQVHLVQRLVQMQVQRLHAGLSSYNPPLPRRSPQRSL
jgi:hypothetical protein